MNINAFTADYKHSQSADWKRPDTVRKKPSMKNSFKTNCSNRLLNLFDKLTWAHLSIISMGSIYSQTAIQTWLQNNTLRATVR